jgi:hypothetical protein
MGFNMFNDSPGDSHPSRFCCSLAPTNDVKLNDTGKVQHGSAQHGRANSAVFRTGISEGQML